MAKKVKLIIFIFGLVALATWANFVLAADFGIQPINNVINLSTGDPRVIAARLIQIALSFLGIIVLVLIIYAGFLWMTSSGDEDKITKAKQILRNAVIGLVIILSSWAITTFILAKLLEAIGGIGVNPGGGGGNLIDPGIGAIGNCTVQSFYPENGQTDVARNSSIIITFKEKLQLSSVCANAAGQACACGGSSCNRINPTAIRIFKTDLGDACSSGTCPNINTNTNVTDVIVAVSSDNKTLVLTPLSYLGNPTTNIWYSVKMSSDLKKESDGSSMFKTCYVNYFIWKFEVGTRFDLTPPQVVYGGIFPRPDNEQDIQNQIADAIAAKGSVTVNDCPSIYQASTIVSVVPAGSTPAATATPLNYRGNLTKFRVVVSSDPDRAQLFDGNNSSNLLGSADFDLQGNARFAGYFILKAPNRSVGSEWNITLTPEQLADSLTIGEEVYTFSSTPSASVGNNIYVDPNNCDINDQADEVFAVLSGHPQINVDLTTNKINLTAKVAGASGNQIIINTTNQTALQIEAMAGGIDRQDLAQTNDKRDVPMNTVIQINFSESVNPLQVSGLASEVADYIRIVNFDGGSKVSGASCSLNEHCRSYKCEGPINNKTCVGNYIDGKFLVSNIYKTVEFISDNECGINGCGEKIYCLPSNSHLKVEMESADLKNCVTNTDCLAFTPFNTCALTPLGYNTCQNIENKNYPTATSTFNGIIDTAINSFDGDRNIFSDGPINFYNDNYQASSSVNLDKKDNYFWSFYVNDKIMLAPPQIETVTPSQGTMGVALADPIKIFWNTLMMNSSLTTGSRIITIGTSTTVEHKLINLWSATPTGTGYWIANDNIDTGILDNEPDKTISWLKHSALAEFMSYRAQAGSGIKDIYQNCYKPSAGPGCSVTETTPSCCLGVETSTLSIDGNCQ